MMNDRERWFTEPRLTKANRLNGSDAAIPRVLASTFAHGIVDRFEMPRSEAVTKFAADDRYHPLQCASVLYP
jgi:hypothetical protein